MIKEIDISKLTLLEDNPRQISKENFDRLKRDIKKDPEFLKSRPILVNETKDKLEIYAGNMRYRACKDLGWEKVPVIIEKEIPKKVMRSRALLDNNNYGKWDWDILENSWDVEIKELDLPELKLNNSKLPSCEQKEPEIYDGFIVVLKMSHETMPLIKDKLTNLCDEHGIEINIS